MRKRTGGMDNKSFIKGARRGTIYEENGLYGLKDTDGTGSVIRTVSERDF